MNTEKRRDSFFFLIVFSWQKLLQSSGLRREKLKKAEDRFRNIEELFLRFAKKASAFNSWFENAEEDLTDPVKCNSLEEIRVRFSSFYFNYHRCILGVDRCS